MFRHKYIAPNYHIISIANLLFGGILILITTSDYLPKLGGLSTFTKNLEEVIREIGISYHVFHWKSADEILNYDKRKLEQYDFIINVHVMFCWLMPAGQEKMINFIHGSEILMTSPNWLRRFFKVWKRKEFFGKMSRANFNLFISKATHSKISERGYATNFARDLIFHNCISLKNSKFSKLAQADANEFIFICIARNVPNKNLLGVVSFCENVFKLHKKAVRLIIPKDTGLSSSVISIEELENQSDEIRNKSYERAHYNLLLSLDHSSRGYFEGFGLTVLEAGQFGVPSIVMNTGGIPESVHDGETGYVINSVGLDQVGKIISLKDERIYQSLRLSAFEHTVSDHSLAEYRLFFERIFETRRLA